MPNNSSQSRSVPYQSISKTLVNLVKTVNALQVASALQCQTFNFHYKMQSHAATSGFLVELLNAGNELY